MAAIPEHPVHPDAAAQRSAAHAEFHPRLPEEPYKLAVVPSAASQYAELEAQEDPEAALEPRQPASPQPSPPRSQSSLQSQAQSPELPVQPPKPQPPEPPASPQPEQPQGQPA